MSIIRSYANGNGSSHANGNGAILPFHLRRDWQTALAFSAATSSWTVQA